MPGSGQVQGREIDEIRIRKRDGFFGVTLPVMAVLRGTAAQTAANFTAPFFIAQRDYEVIEIAERHETAGGDAGAVTLDVYRVPSGTAPASGTTVLASTVNLKATANTVQYGTLTATLANRVLNDGESLSLISSGTLTSLVGVTVSILLKAI